MTISRPRPHLLPSISNEQLLQRLKDTYAQLCDRGVQRAADAALDGEREDAALVGASHEALSNRAHALNLQVIAGGLTP